MIVGGAWIALAGGAAPVARRQRDDLSLLLTYIAIALMNHFVEGPLRDPASLNKPSTLPIGDANMIGTIPGTRRALGPGVRHRRLPALYVLMQRSPPSASRMQVIGGNSAPRA